MTVVFVGVGSNLDLPARQVQAGIQALGCLPGSRVLKTSSLYRSPPMGPPDQPDFVNAVVQLDTVLEPITLLDALQGIEQRHGRRRGRRWGERTLDLDILGMGDVSLVSERLTLPHPGVADRDFVLLPWRDIAPDYLVPGLGMVADLAAACPMTGARPMRAVADGVEA